MSYRPIELFCNKCHFNQFVPFLFANHYYEFAGKKEFAPVDYGWCFNCNRLVLYQIGYTSSEIDQKVHGNETIDEIYDFEFLEEYFGGRTTLNNCLECGSLEVLPLNLFLYDGPLNFVHMNCGGRLTLKTDEDTRINLKPENQLIKPVFYQQPKQKVIRSADDIDNYSFITEILKNAIAAERNLLKNNVEKIMGYNSPKLFDQSYYRSFLIERFVFLRAYLAMEDFDQMNTEDMYRYIAAISTKEYDITHREAYELMDKRQNFYVEEFKMLKEMEHPHPGKILWSLHNPSIDNLSHEMAENFEKNILAGMHIIEVIFQEFQKSITYFSKNRN